MCRCIARLRCRTGKFRASTFQARENKNRIASSGLRLLEFGNLASYLRGLHLFLQQVPHRPWWEGFERVPRRRGPRLGAEGSV